jgi:hypothetical protein
MDDQFYDRLVRPAEMSDTWTKKYNTRWVGPMVLNRAP